MGTRHITQVILDGKTVVSQYGQWDGYPEATGADILQFLKDMNREQFIDGLLACIPLPESETKAYWDVAFHAVTIAKLNKENEERSDEDRLSNIEVLAKYNEAKKHYDDTGLINMDVSAYFVKDHPTLQRDMGSDILQFIHDAVGSVDVQLDLDFINDSLMCEWAYVINLDSNVLEVYENGNNLRQSFPLDDLPNEKTFVNICTPADEFKDDEPVSSSKDVFNNVVTDLRTMASGNAPDDAMLTSMMNYIEANKDDFFEAINNT